jgi:serine/threonine protein kinase
MSPGTRPAGVSAEIADENAIKAWLDALASGSCDAAEFLLFVQERFKSADGSWEVLSQLDQYFRRGRIKDDVFHAVKTSLAESALGLRNTRAAPPNSPAAARETPAPAREPPAAAREAPAPAREAPATAREIPAAAREAPPPREIPVAVDVVIPPEHTAESASDIKPGSVLRRRYRIESLLGQSAMGTVYQALDEFRLDVPPGGQRLAIKVLHTAVAKRAELLTELRQEFQHLQMLSHPHILRVYEFDRDGPVVFFTMELLHGAPLSRVLQVRKHVPLERAQAMAAVRDIGAALVYAHSRGVIHGNINPQNIFVTTPGELRVRDFGNWHRSSRIPAALDNELTLPFATAGYASCEVLEGEPADARDDIFALACVAYLLFCGAPPFPKKTAAEARDAGLVPHRPQKLTNQQWQTLREGLAFEREDRPADMQEWLERLDLRAAAKQLAPLPVLQSSSQEEYESHSPKSVSGRSGPDRSASDRSFSAKSLTALAAVAAVALLLAAGYWVISHQGPSTSKQDLASGNSAPPPSDRTPAVEPVTPLASPLASQNATAAQTATPQTAAPQTAAPQTAAPQTAPPQSAATQSAAPAATLSPQAVPVKTPPSVAASASPSAVPSAGASGSTRVELAADTVDVPATEFLAQIPVHRKGSLRGEAQFRWWTESGTAKPGVDFSPVVPQLAYIGEGKSSISLSITLSTARRTQPKSFYVVIDQSEGGANLGPRTLTMVTLQPPD